MREGEVLSPAPGETITCIRSGLAGGPFVFEMVLEPGARPPPTHTHDEHDETIEVLEGEITFRVNGQTRLLRAGESLTLTPSEPHTFWNPSKTATLRARVTHGPRFERLIVQPGFLQTVMYLTQVDPGASRTTHPLLRLGAPVLAWIGRLRGLQLRLD